MPIDPTQQEEREPPPRPLDVVLGGLDAAALVLATVFLASGAVRREVDTLAWGLALFALAVGAGFAARWLTDERIASPGWRRAGRALLVTTGGFAVVVAVRGVQTLWSIGGGGRGDATSVDRGGPISRLLLVTVDDPAAIPAGRGVEGLGELETVLHASPRRDAALASILTGLEVIEHRLLFDGDAPRSRALTAAEALAELGFRTAAFGGAALPRWARRGVADTFEGAGLRDAVAWLEPAGRSFAHVHVAAGGALAAGDLRTAALRAGAVVVVVTLPGGDPGPLTVEAARARVLVSTSRLRDVGPRSTTEILPTLLDGAGVDWRPTDVPVAPFDELPDGPLAVCFRHGGPDEVHRAIALSAARNAPSGALEISRLPGGGVDDWAVGGEVEEHLVYRTGVRPIGETPAVRAAGPDLLDLFAEWRERNGAREIRREAVGAIGR